MFTKMSIVLVPLKTEGVIKEITVLITLMQIL